MADAEDTATRRTVSTTTSTAARTPLRTQALQNRRRRQLTRSHAVVSFDSNVTCYSAADTASPAPSSSSSSSLLNDNPRRYRAPDACSTQPTHVETMVLLRTDTHRHIRVVRPENQAKSNINASQVPIYTHLALIILCKNINHFNHIIRLTVCIILLPEFNIVLHTSSECRILQYRPRRTVNKNKNY